MKLTLALVLLTLVAPDAGWPQTFNRTEQTYKYLPITGCEMWIKKRSEPSPQSVLPCQQLAISSNQYSRNFHFMVSSGAESLKYSYIVNHKALPDSDGDTPSEGFYMTRNEQITHLPRDGGYCTITGDFIRCYWQAGDSLIFSNARLR